MKENSKRQKKNNKQKQTAHAVVVVEDDAAADVHDYFVGCCLCLILKFMQEIIAELQLEVLCLFWAFYFHMQSLCAEHILSTYIYSCICMLYV